MTWVKEHLPGLSPVMAAGVVLGLLTVISLLGLAYYQQRRLQAQNLASITISNYETNLNLAMLLGVSAVQFDQPFGQPAGFTSKVALMGAVQSNPNYLKAFSDHSAEVFSVAFSPDGRRLASGSADNTIILWDAETGRRNQVALDFSSSKNLAIMPVTSRGLPPYAGHIGSIYSITLSPEGTILASGGADTSVRLWDMNPNSWQAKVCQRAGSNLSSDEWGRYFGLWPYYKVCPQWPVGVGVTRFDKYQLFIGIGVTIIVISIPFFVFRRRMKNQ